MSRSPFILLIICAFLASCQAGKTTSSGSDVARMDRLEKKVRSVPKPTKRPNIKDYSNYSESLSFLKKKKMSTKERKKKFVTHMLPKVKAVNNETLIKRQRVLELEKKQNLSKNDKKWLDSLSEEYRVPNQKGSYNWKALKHRVDVLPISMVMAQAALESSWGTSPFAQKANNLFGQQCYSKGCGVMPKRRPKGKSYEVAKYRSAKESIRAYVLNINRHNAYKQVRALRSEARKNDLPLKGMLLADGLLSYSEEGKLYPKKVKSVIISNKFALLDE